MGNGWAPKDITLNTAGTTIPASQSAAPVSKEVGLSAGGAIDGVVFVVDVSAVSGTVPIQLQQSAGVNVAGTEVWENVTGKTVNAASGRNYIRVSSAQDPTLVPLLAKCRLVATTDGGESVSIERALILQPL